MALIIKDGAGSTTSLKTTLTGSDHMPHHIVQAVSGTVAVTSSVANPVYVTGNISVNQPISVDVDISDKLTVVVSSSENNNTVWVTSSATYPVYTRLSNITTTGIPGGGTALVVSLSGSTGSFNQVQLYDSYVTIANTGINQLIGYLTAATDLGDSDYRLKVITTGSSAVTINNNAADTAFNALSYSFADNSLKVKLTGSNTVQEGPYDILLVRGTGSQTEITNTGFNQLINYITAATDLGNSDYRLKVNVLNTASVNVSNIGADVAFTALSYSFADNSLKVKLTGSNTIQEGPYDILLVRGTGSQTEITNTGFGQLVNSLTAAIDTGDNTYKLLVKTTGSSAVTIDNNFADNAFAALSSSFSSSALRVVLGNSVNTIDIDSYKALVVKLTSSSTEVTNTSTEPLYVTASGSLSVKEKPVKTSTVNAFNYPGQFNWTVNSGTFVLAAEDENRKGLMISNPSQENLYIIVGSGSTNGFTLNSTGSAPDVFSFIIYPSGTYIAEPVMAAAFHAGFFVSQSNFVQIPNAMSTKVTY